jgi:hypothetical protein
MKRNAPKSRTEGARGGRRKGVTHLVLDGSAYERFLEALGPGGDLELAAKAIRGAAIPGYVPSTCARTTLWRHLKRLKAGQPVRITQPLLAQMQRAAELAGQRALKNFHRATLPPVVQDRLRMHFRWLDAFSPYVNGAGYWAVKQELYRRYNQPGSPIWNFRNWMDQRFIRPRRQEIAMWRILVPLVEHQESGGIEPTCQDFLVKDSATGEEQDEKLLRFLHLGIEREQLLLEVRGNDLLRAHTSTVVPTPPRRAPRKKQRDVPATGSTAAYDTPRGQRRRRTGPE